MDRFTRFKLLRGIWARAKHLLAWLHGPRAREERLRAQVWQQVNVAQRQVLDGLIRGPGDPDSAVRPQARQWAADAAYRAQAAAQRQAMQARNGR